MNTMLRQALGFAVLLVILAPQPVSSQTDLPILPGHRVRLTVSEGKPAAHSVAGMWVSTGEAIVGDWEANSEGVIRLRDQSGMGSWQIPAESVEQIEVSLGKRRRIGRSVFLSTVGFAAGFGFIGAVSWKPCNEVGFMACFLTPTSRSESIAWGAGVGAILGLPIGLLIGLRKHETWRAESTQGLKASIQPGPGGRIGLGLTLPAGGHHSP
jgi:hypothetical protein